MSSGSKTVAGLKVPKDVRRSIGTLRKLAGKPLVSDTIAAALIAGAAALAQNKGRSEAAKAAGLGAAAAAVKATKGADRLAVAVAIALLELAAGRMATKKSRKARKGKKSET